MLHSQLPTEPAAVSCSELPVPLHCDISVLHEEEPWAFSLEDIDSNSSVLLVKFVNLHAACHDAHAIKLKLRCMLKSPDPFELERLEAQPAILDFGKEVLV